MRSTRVDGAALLLRLTVGGLLLFHGYDKISMGVTEGLGYVEGQLGKQDLPLWMAWGVYVGELVAPALLIVGLFVPLAGLAVAGTMGMAVFLSHQGQLAQLGAQGGYALELQALFLFGGLCCALLGAGRFSILGGRDKSGLPS